MTPKVFIRSHLYSHYGGKKLKMCSIFNATHYSKDISHSSEKASFLAVNHIFRGQMQIKSTGHCVVKKDITDPFIDNTFD